MIETAYGVVSTDDTSTEVSAEFAQLYAWATRPGLEWPASDLATLDSISATFDASGDMVDVQFAYDGKPPVGVADIDGAEIDAWSSDVLRAAGLTDHPAIRNAEEVVAS
jgi:hypothetical protein